MVRQTQSKTSLIGIIDEECTVINRLISAMLGSVKETLDRTVTPLRCLVIGFLLVFGAILVMDGVAGLT